MVERKYKISKWNRPRGSKAETQWDIHIRTLPGNSERSRNIKINAVSIITGIQGTATKSIAEIA